jgi:carboxypeptidase C (cathepsin A)
MAVVLAVTTACAAASSGMARAQSADPSPDAAASALPIPPVRTVVTHHEARIGGKLLRYTATAGTLLLEDSRERPTASVFYIAYAAEGLGPTSRRPITFSYNGGPGGSSALVDLGAFGPRTIVTANADQSPPPPYDIVDNGDSVLDRTDLVFVDAVGTGFSRLAGKGTAKDYYGVDEDGKAFTQFIRRYLSANDRWNSPKYLAGESYGTTRSAVLAKMLQNSGIALSGIVLMSTVLDFATVEGGRGDDKQYWTLLPSETAVAAYHRKLPDPPSNVDALLAEVRDFAAGPFAQALARGDALPAADRDRMAARLHAYTGLSVDYLVRSNLRVSPDRFEKVLLGDQSQTVGRYDARFRGLELDPIGADAESDPASDAVFGAFTASFNRYVRQELNYVSDSEYLFLSGDVNRQWNWNRGRSEPVATDVIGDLAEAMTANRYLHVLSVNGLYDLATPFFATEYALHHLGLPAPVEANVSFRYYPSGHMIYLNPVAHAALKNDLDAFYDATARS